MNARLWVDRAMHAAFFLLLASSAARLVARHEVTGLTVAALVGSLLLAVVYAGGAAAGYTTARWRYVWFGAVVVLWLVTVELAPSFAWCAVPLYFLALRLLPGRVTIAVAVVLTLAVIVGGVRIADVVEPSLFLAPIGIAVMIAAFFWLLNHEITQRQRLIDDLAATRDSLAASQREAGMLAERERLSREIHDTLAQGLSSMGMLLQAAGRVWGTDPDAAREHVERAGAVAAENLDEARRFVRDLRPPRLDDTSLAEALRVLCADVDRENPVAVRFRLEGVETTVDDRVRLAVLRVAQSALSNVVEHAGASAAVVTLSFLGAELSLDVVDDGAGFPVGEPVPGDGLARADVGSGSGPQRGYGIPGMRDRLAELGGELTIENTPGEGTALAARIPLPPERKRAS
ncbi:sensor histidine kinase [Stackebrandtia nassauensis]|uniref:Histidine kinase n=1 Tax=Stackebrandtia nassauensis (strain DSM 44728 / CIP 108903 / NRRL B-16338 / NBRC 102104 / LLR-40K-21) TaxID=446470 RepID=D3PYN5_STANL|nr:sensor histidine kinase [Stackebrandtia nassauensis]ADD43468.1 histidine kinase [Stackebrandtia nassauensis DSM 44728]